MLETLRAALELAEAERLDLKRRYVELGERFERMLIAEDERRLEEMQSFGKDANRQTEDKLVELLEDAETQRRESAARLQLAEETIAARDSEAARLRGLLDSASVAHAEEKGRLRKLSLIPEELSRVKSELKTLGEYLRAQRHALTQPRADALLALSGALGVEFTEDDFSDTATLSLKIRAAVDLQVDSATLRLRGDFVQLREETVSLRDAWAAESPAREDRSFEVARLSRECQRFKDLLTSRDSQLSQLLETRQAQLRASLSPN